LGIVITGIKWCHNIRRHGHHVTLKFGETFSVKLKFQFLFAVRRPRALTTAIGVLLFHMLIFYLIVFNNWMFIILFCLLILWNHWNVKIYNSAVHLYLLNFSSDHLVTICNSKSNLFRRRTDPIRKCKWFPVSSSH
jgi:hypothetical protein